MPAEETIVITQPVIVDIRSVDKELTNLWRRAAEGELPGVSPSVTRVLLSNLLVYAQTDAEAEEVERIIAEMSAEHPTRAVVADAQPGDGQQKLEAGVSVLCNISEQGARLCGEEIRIHAHDTDEAALGAIIPLLAPDLPIYLWTPGEIDTADQTLRSLARLSDHWIIDSRRSRKWAQALEFTSEFCLGCRPQLGLHDLAWASVSHWREVIAQMFDSASARRYLRGINTVDISFRPEHEGPATEAVMIAAWLARQLDWTEPTIHKEGDDWLIQTHSDSRELSVRLLPDPTSTVPVSMVTIEAESDAGHATFRSAVAGEEELTTQIEASDLPSPRRTTRLPSASKCREVCQVLDTPGRDRLYERALPVIREIARQIEEAHSK